MRGPVADVNFVIDRFEERLGDRGRQAFAQDDGIAFAVLQALDAKLRLLDRDRRIGIAGHGNERSEIDLAAPQRIGELKADAGLIHIVVDLVIDDAEAMLLAHVS